MAEPRHTIVLVQHSQDPKTRTFQDYDTVTSAMDGDPTPNPRCEARSRLRAMSLMPLDARVAGVCKMYEKKLKQLNPTVRQISYDIADLFRYVDSLGDLCCLVFDPSTNQYAPHNKEWIKDRVFNILKKQAQ